MSTVLDVVSAVALLVGAAFCLLAAVGLHRFPDVVCRLHAAAKAQTLGVLLILLGTAAQAPAKYAVPLVLVALFQLVTVPVTGQIVGRTAFRTGAVHRPGLVRDELGERLESDPREGGGPRDADAGTGYAQDGGARG
ncbi:monovalent cation/H(+) antiporter subunit G [Streptomyces sp. TRM 70351]|uniref:monovalent cation/H(+) antiporter subunit G n=1 Tax=Streptomyces sp. TRM 70351 TaxID=3116552 RepID=UPI002E7ACC4D|nr:monovalent cation/H(+) antiporter subunit G [Streptomyces sp. TRM 70351]MEE1929546.1 monovalent cation/H(+) antiporter subunit G [Streptomyces sp. TRM 70351]